MGLFGKSFEDKVQSALEKVRAQFPTASINAQVNEDVVTLTGRAPDMPTKSGIMAAFNNAVEAKNTINQLAVDQPAGQQPGSAMNIKPQFGTTAASEPRTHEVAAGETLTHLAQRYYGDASKFNRIFEANRDQLSDPDKVRAGQKLKIPL